MNTDMGSRGGTVHAPLEALQSVAGMRGVVAGLRAADSGKFFDLHGRAVQVDSI